MSNNEKPETKENKKSKWFNKKTMSAALIVVVLLTIVYAINIFLHNNKHEGKGLTACQEIYSAKVDNFSKATGLNHGNIVFNAPIVTEKRNLYVFDFNDIDLGEQKDSFLCYYNVNTHKAVDRTPEPDFSQN